MVSFDGFGEPRRVSSHRGAVRPLQDGFLNYWRAVIPTVNGVVESDGDLRKCYVSILNWAGYPAAAPNSLLGLICR